MNKLFANFVQTFLFPPFEKMYCYVKGQSFFYKKFFYVDIDHVENRLLIGMNELWYV